MRCLRQCRASGGRTPSPQIPRRALGWIGDPQFASIDEPKLQIATLRVDRIDPVDTVAECRISGDIVLWLPQCLMRWNTEAASHIKIGLFSSCKPSMQFIQVDFVAAASTRTITQRMENCPVETGQLKPGFGHRIEVICRFEASWVQQSDEDQLRLPMCVFCPLKDRQTTLHGGWNAGP